MPCGFPGEQIATTDYEERRKKSAVLFARPLPIHNGIGRAIARSLDISAAITRLSRQFDVGNSPRTKVLENLVLIRVLLRETFYKRPACSQRCSPNKRVVSTTLNSQ